MPLFVKLGLVRSLGDTFAGAVAYSRDPTLAMSAGNGGYLEETFAQRQWNVSSGAFEPAPEGCCVPELGPVLAGCTAILYMASLRRMRSFLA